MRTQDRGALGLYISLSGKRDAAERAQHVDVLSVERWLNTIRLETGASTTNNDLRVSMIGRIRNLNMRPFR